MPSQHPSLRTDEAVRFIEERCFPGASTGPVPSSIPAASTPASSTGPVPSAIPAASTPAPGAGAARGPRCGVEVEWLTAPLANAAAHLPIAAARALIETAGSPPRGSRVTLEPGGQIELSSPTGSPSEIGRIMQEDAAAVRERLRAAGVATHSLGLDPLRVPRRVLDAPRYVAMEQFFDRQGPAGRFMMCSTASIQVNLDLGQGAEQEERWRLANLLGPTLSAAFANSPLRDGVPSGWRSTRADVWRRLDLSRTSPVPLGGNAANAWARYALNAQVMLVREPSGRFLPGLEHLTFGAWMARGHDVGFPDIEDLGYHLTTLFPPVRPRGWLELRFIDALGDPWWRVPLLVAAALVCDPEAADVARRACAPAATLWAEGARHGLGHPVLGKAAAACFEAALGALDRIGADAPGREAVEDYTECYVARGRCPADDVLDTWAASGSLFPTDPVLESAWNQ